MVSESGRSQRRPFRTLLEQIADDLGASIALGEIRSGAWLREQDVAERYEVSRGPVRKALQLLSARGLVVLHPRRGAQVVGLTVDAVSDLFNIRAVILGLAARYFAVIAGHEAQNRLDAAIGELQRAGQSESLDAAPFLAATIKVSEIIAQNCGSESLDHLITDQNDNSPWRALWQSGGLDFLSRDRRLAATADYVEMNEAIHRRDGAQAEAIVRRTLMHLRENAVAALASARGQSYDERRMLSA